MESRGGADVTDRQPDHWQVSEHYPWHVQTDEHITWLVGLRLGHVSRLFHLEIHIWTFTYKPVWDRRTDERV